MKDFFKNLQESINREDTILVEMPGPFGPMKVVLVNGASVQINSVLYENKNGQLVKTSVN